MVVILVHWLIKKGKEKEFVSAWHSMTVRKDCGLYREILTTVDYDHPDDKFHTFSIEDRNYVTFINIGIWRSVEDFDREIGPKIRQPEIVTENGRTLVKVTMEEFEFKLRERIVLKKITDRGTDLPTADLDG